MVFMCKIAGIFFIKRQLSYKNIFCKKTDFLHKKGAFLQKYIFVKKEYFYKRLICKKAAFYIKKAVFLQPVNS